MNKRKTIIVEQQEILISEVDEDKINENTKLSDLDKLIFGISKLKGTGLKIYHKNNRPYDFRRCNLIMTDEKTVEFMCLLDIYFGQIQHYLTNPIGIHLDTYGKGYQIIYFNKKDRIIVSNKTAIGEAVKEFNKFLKPYK